MSGSHRNLTVAREGLPPPHVIARSNLGRAAIEKEAARRTLASGWPVQSCQWQSSTSLVIRGVSPTSGNAFPPTCRWSELGSGRAWISRFRACQVKRCSKYRHRVPELQLHQRQGGRGRVDGGWK